MRLKLFALIGLASLAGGCTFVSNPVYDSEEVYVEETTVVDCYVDTYIPLSDPIAELLAPRTVGYFSPRSSRYSDFLYYHDFPRNSTNLPCYVQGDFNGDQIDDYAFLFTDQTEYTTYWSIETKLIVVLSSACCYEVALEMDLGSIEADYSYPIEEYWAIAKMPAGTHTYYASYGATDVEETVVLDNDAFVLRFLETEEEDLFYALDDDMYYMTWDPGSLEKKAAMRKQTENRKVNENWRDKIQMRKK